MLPASIRQPRDISYFINRFHFAALVRHPPSELAQFQRGKKVIAIMSGAPTVRLCEKGMFVVRPSGGSS
jgi:hypothetical protein